MIGVFVALGALSWWSENSVSTQRWPAEASPAVEESHSSVKTLFAPDSLHAESTERDPATTKAEPLEIEPLDP
jgi:hypothetical protein